MAIAVRDVTADELLDDVALDQHCPDAAGQVAEQGSEPVVQVGVDHNLDRLSGAKGQGLDGLGCRSDVVAPPGHAEGKVLTYVTDAGRASGQGGDCVLDRGRRADDEIPEMRRYRRRLGQGGEILRFFQNQTGSPGHVGPLGGRIAHAPVQTNAVAVHPVAGRGQPLVNLGVGPSALGRTAIPELGVEHDRSLGHPLALVLAL